MGNLLFISFDDEFDRINYFNALLAVGCTVRDIVRLGLGCKGLRSWVCTMVASLDLAPFRALLASLPAFNAMTFRRLFQNVSRFQAGCVCWEKDPGRRSSPRLLEMSLNPVGKIELSAIYAAYCTVLLEIAPLPTQGVYTYYYTQWYPMLDTAVKTATARFRHLALAAKLKEDAQVVHSMRVNRGQ